MGRLFNRQSGKRAKLDEFCQSGVQLRKAIQRPIKREDRLIIERRHFCGFIDRNQARTVAALLGHPPSCVVDQNSSHDLCGGAKEVSAILPIDLALVDEPKVCLVNESRGLQSVIGSLFTELAGGDPPELRVDQRQ